MAPSCPHRRGYHGAGCKRTFCHAISLPLLQLLLEAYPVGLAPSHRTSFLIMRDTPHTLATHKAIFLGAWLPLGVMTLISQFARVDAMSLELSIGQMLLWPLPTLCVLVGSALLISVTLTILRTRRVLQTALFTCYALMSVLLMLLEGAAMNFAHVTGSLLDAQMLEYAFTNAEGAWDLISSSTPTALKILLALIAVSGLFLPHVLRRKLTPTSRHLPSRIILIPGALILLCLPFAIAPLVGKTHREANTSLPAVYTIITSMLHDDPMGTAHTLPYSTRYATLEPTDQKPRNVVIILLESTRASATTIHNPDLPTTPFLNKLADKSLTAMHAYTVVPHTSKAIVSTGCGMTPYLDVSILESSKAGMPQRCLARLLGEAGYATAFFQSATQRFENRAALVKNMGFEHFYPLERLEQKGFKKANYFGLEDNVMLKPSMAWIARQQKPFFLTYLTVTPHHEYLAPDTYGRHNFSSNTTLNRYLNSVRYVDHFVENVITELKKQGVYEHTVIAILGDHGEAFGEHKLSQHDKIMYEETLAIPFLIHDPSRPELTTRIMSPVNQLDLMPTLIELSNHTLAQGTLPGMSLTEEIPQDRTLHAFCWAKNTCGATLKGRTKMIHNFGRRPDEFYDLVKDPTEKNSSSGQVDPKDVDALLDWRASINNSYNTHLKQYSEEFVTSSRQTPSQPIHATFDDRINLYGYDLKVSNELGLQSVTLHTYFEVKKEIPPGWTLFVHGVNATGKMKNLDHIPLEGMLPVEEFEEGTFIKDPFTFTIPETAPRGTYKIFLGFWHPDKGRMKATLDGAPVEEDRLLLTTLEVTH